jgi:hypothetical protein
MPWLLTYITGQLPPGRAGVASGILNLAREVFGLLSVTVLGAILTTRRATELRAGAQPLHAFLSGYQLALLIAAAIIAAGIPVSLHALRTPRTAPPAPASRAETTTPVTPPARHAAAAMNGPR